MNLISTTNLSKDLAADKISAESHGSAQAYITSEAIQGELFGGCGTEAVSNSNVKSFVNVEDNSNISADNVDLKAENFLFTGAYNPKEKERLKNKNNFSYSAGGITGSSVKSKQESDSFAQVKIGKNATILASKEINIDSDKVVDAADVYSLPDNSVRLLSITRINNEKGTPKKLTARIFPLDKINEFFN